MADNLDKADIVLNHQIPQLEVFQQNSQRLQLEAFKIDSLLTMFNNCADRCHLQYRESGINASAKGKEVSEDVQCFTNCITKTHKITQLIYQ